MKNFVRIVLLSLALGAAGLLAGCASHRSTASRWANDFEVVETSSKRPLTAQEMVQLRAAVAKFLEKEGATSSGDYYVKVYLAPDKDGVPADWVVVRFTRDTDLRFSLLASYPAGSPAYRSSVAYDYYPYGYDNFGRISFQYYDDPFYGNHYYFPRRNNDRNRHHDGKRGRDRDHDGKDGDRDGQPRNKDAPRFKPIPAVGSQPVTRPRRDNNSNATDNQPRWHNPRTVSTSQPSQQEASSTPARTNHYPRHGGAPVSRPADPAPERTSSQTTTRSESTSRESSRGHDSSRSRDSGRSSSSSSSRSESSKSSNSEKSSDSERTPRETKGTGSVFSRGRD